MTINVSPYLKIIKTHLHFNQSDTLQLEQSISFMRYTFLGILMVFLHISNLFPKFFFRDLFHHFIMFQVFSMLSLGKDFEF